MHLEMYCIEVVKKIHASIKDFFLRLAFVLFLLHLVFVAACRLSPIAVSGAYSLVDNGWASHCSGFSYPEHGL